MRSIESNFQDLYKKQKAVGMYICLALAVRSKGFSRKALVKAFNSLVPKDEHLENEKKELVDHLEYLTKMPRGGRNLG